MTIFKLGFKNKNHLFKRYLISYFIVLIIPITIISLWLYSHFIIILKQEIITNNINSLNKVKLVVDAELEQLQKTSSQIYFNKNIVPFNFLNEPVNAITVINELKNYSSSNNFFSEILLYYHNDNYLYSAVSSYSLSKFINDIYHYTNWNEKDFISTVTSVKAPTNRPVEDVIADNSIKKRYVTFMYPLSAYSTKPYGTVFFLVEESAFKNLMESSLKDYGGNTIIFDKNNKIISCLENKDYLNSKEFLSLIDMNNNQNGDNLETTKTIKLNGQKYFFFLVKSNDSGFKYVNLIPIDKVMKSADTVRMQFLYGIIIIFLLGSIVIYYLMQINYSPINQLKMHVENTFSNKQNNLNEIETIKQSFDFLSQENTKLTAKVQDSNTANKDFIINKLLKGDIINIEEFNLKCKDYNIVFTNQLFMVVILDIMSSDEVNSISKNDILNTLEHFFTNDFKGYALDRIEHNKFILLLNIDENKVSEIEPLLIRLQSNISKTFNLIVTIGVGNHFNSTLDIPKSYMEASTALDYKFIKGINKVIFFNEVIPKEKELSLYPQKTLDELKIAIRQGNVEQIEKVLYDVRHYIKENNVPIFMARGLCFDIINIVVNSVDTINKELVICKKDYPDVFSFMKLETVDELTDIIKKVCIDICNSVKETKENTNSNLITNMIAYINDNYSSCEFSIQEMADYFNISFPNLSQYFKENTGQTILDYVTYLKIEKAKELLTSSNIPLKDIAVDVGYYNVSSFIRRFKQVTGITPGEYRKLNK